MTHKVSAKKPTNNRNRENEGKSTFFLTLYASTGEQTAQTDGRER